MTTQEVPLEATLASAPPKSSVSRFKAELTARHAPNESSLPSHSLGSSVVPSSSISTMKRAVRMGKLENGNLIGGEEGESDDEVVENTRALLEALTRGEVTNIGPGTQSSVHSPPNASSHSVPIEQNTQLIEQPKPSKVSRFKLSITQPSVIRQGTLSPASSSAAPTPTDFAHRSSPKLFSPQEDTIQEATPAMSSSSAPPRFTLPAELQSAVQNGQLQMPGMIVASPSLFAPQAAASQTLQTTSIGGQTSPTSSLSPSSTAVATPTSAEPSALSASAPNPAPMRQSVVERRPPVVVTNGAQSQPAKEGITPKVSRFKARRS